MAHLIHTREAVVRMAAQMAADGDDTRHLASEQSAYRSEIETVTRLVWDDGMEPEEAVAEVLAATIQVRRHNGQCQFGDWMPVSEAPEWVADEIGDQIAENDVDSGRVERAGSIWVWRSYAN